MTEETDRRTRLLDEAERLVAEAGLGAVTHRSVEKAAGAPHGSVTYWFSSRDGLIAALVDRLCDESERRAALVAALAQDQLEGEGELDVDAVSAALVQFMDVAARHHLVRLELELQSTRDPAHAERMTRAAATFWAMCAAVSAALGSTDPERDGRAMASMIDGLLLDRLTHPGQEDAVIRAGIGWLLAGAARD
jgi:AcrR family transcriptional regulator